MTGRHRRRIATRPELKKIQFELGRGQSIMELSYCNKLVCVIVNYRTLIPVKNLTTHNDGHCKHPDFPFARIVVASLEQPLDQTLLLIGVYESFRLDPRDGTGSTFAPLSVAIKLLLECFFCA